MNVVTISRQLGSLGSDIGKAVAERLNFNYVWREVINQAAVLAGAPEAALAMLDEFGLIGVSLTEQQNDDYLKGVSQVLKKLAKKGNVVIVGRAGQVVLAGERNALHVRIVAPVDLRVKRVAASKGVNLEAAQAQVETSDRTRKGYLKRYYHIDWDAPTLYDLIINTESIACQNAADMICSQLPAPQASKKD